MYEGVKQPLAPQEENVNVFNPTPRRNCQMSQGRQLSELPSRQESRDLKLGSVQQSPVSWSFFPEKSPQHLNKEKFCALECMPWVLKLFWFTLEIRTAFVQPCSFPAFLGWKILKEREWAGMGSQEEKQKRKRFEALTENQECVRKLAYSTSCSNWQEKISKICQILRTEYCYLDIIIPFCRRANQCSRGQVHIIIIWSSWKLNPAPADYQSLL